MAEAAGLVLGAVGIVGIIGAFKDTIDLFNLFADLKHQGRDYEALDTALDIEKLLLLRWAEGVRLSKDDYDKRLDDPSIQTLLMRVFSSISSLLNNAPELKERYGLVEIGSDSDMVLVHRDTVDRPKGRDSSWGRFVQNFQAHQSQLVDSRREVPLTRKIRWVIRDKQKFELLVQKLGYFSTKLKDLLPIQESLVAQKRPVLDDERDDCDVKRLKSLHVVTSSSRGHSATRDELCETDSQLQERILRKLWFRKINERRRLVKKAHSKTLQWALAPFDDSTWHSLSQWLQHGSGIYWVSGKAGSGKSTLMKHIYDDPRTLSFLSQWADGQGITVCDYFFMSLGSSLQKSHEGLARTILHRVLSENRRLISKALTDLWQDMRGTYGEDDASISLPTLSEMSNAYKVITDSDEDVGKFCIFIDGLDEFDGNSDEAVNLVKSLVVSKRIKIVVSSRPIPACAAAFHECPGLRLEHLNRSDITAYVNDTIGKHHYMQNLIAHCSRINQGSEGQGNMAEQMIKSIVDKSSGVFLWIVLACRSLLDGLVHYERPAELRARVDELPSELHDMFRHMLSKIEKRHREEGARLLRVCYQHAAPPWQTDENVMSALGLAIASNEQVAWASPRLLDDITKRDFCDELDGRLRSRCGGLLEVQTRRKSSACFCSETGGGDKGHDVMIDANVEFMHRTVFEFLNDKGVWNLDCLRIPVAYAFDHENVLAAYGLQVAAQSLFQSVAHKRPSAFVGPLWDGIRYAMKVGCSQNGYLEKFFTHWNSACNESSTSAESLPILGSPSQAFHPAVDHNLVTDHVDDPKSGTKGSQSSSEFLVKLPLKNHATKTSRLFETPHTSELVRRVEAACLRCCRQRIRCNASGTGNQCKPCAQVATRQPLFCVRTSKSHNPFGREPSGIDPSRLLRSLENAVRMPGFLHRCIQSIAHPSPILLHPSVNTTASLNRLLAADISLTEQNIPSLLNIDISTAILLVILVDHDRVVSNDYVEGDVGAILENLRFVACARFLEIFNRFAALNLPQGWTEDWVLKNLDLVLKAIETAVAQASASANAGLANIGELVRWIKGYKECMLGPPVPR